MAAVVAPVKSKTKQEKSKRRSTSHQRAPSGDFSTDDDDLAEPPPAQVVPGASSRPVPGQLTVPALPAAANPFESFMLQAVSQILAQSTETRAALDETRALAVGTAHKQNELIEKFDAHEARLLALESRPLASPLPSDGGSVAPDAGTGASSLPRNSGQPGVAPVASHYVPSTLIIGGFDRMAEAEIVKRIEDLLLRIPSVQRQAVAKCYCNSIYDNKGFVRVNSHVSDDGLWTMV